LQKSPQEAAMSPQQQQARQKQGSWIVISLRILSLLLDYQIKTFVRFNAAKMAKVMLPALPDALESGEVQKTEIFAEVLAKIMAVYPKVDPVGQEIYPKIQGGIQNLFSLDKVPVNHIVIIFQKVINIRQDFVLDFQTPFVQLIEKLVNQHCESMRQNQKPQESSVLVSCLKLFSEILEKVSVQTRAQFFQAILSLLQISSEESLLVIVLTHLKEWIKCDMDNSTRQEFIKKFKRFQKVRACELQTAFLEVVYIIYSDPKASTTEKRELRGLAFIGMSSLKPSLREYFFNIINDEINKDLVHRFSQVIFKAET